MTGSLDAGDGRFQASGAGNITLKGHGGMVGLDVSGAGSARLSEFAATGMSVKLSGTSRAAVNLKGKLDAAVSGVSKLSYSGEVEMGAVKVSGMSRLERE